MSSSTLLLLIQARSVSVSKSTSPTLSLAIPLARRPVFSAVAIRARSLGSPAVSNIAQKISGEGCWRVLLASRDGGT